MDIIDADEILCGCGWNDGGCVALAEALVEIMPGAELVGLENIFAGGAGHYGALWQGVVFDGDGAHTPRGWERYFSAAEQGGFRFMPEPWMAEGLVSSEKVTSDLVSFLRPVLNHPEQWR